MSRSLVQPPIPATPNSLCTRHGADARSSLTYPGRRVLRALLILVAAMLLVAGSLTAHDEEHLANSITRPTKQGIPSHTCTPTICRIDTSAPRVAGGWPDPYLAALLILASLGCAVAAMWLGSGRDAVRCGRGA